MQVRLAEERDRDFIAEMARLAAGLNDRPLPSPDDPAVLGLLPGPTDLALLASDDRKRLVGAAWWHFHAPPLGLDDRGDALPELTMAVRADAQGRGIGGQLLEELASKAAEQFETLALNVHMRNPAARLYMRSGFKVAGKGRGWFGVAMVRTLNEAPGGRRLSTST